LRAVGIVILVIQLEDVRNDYKILVGTSSESSENSNEFEFRESVAGDRVTVYRDVTSYSLVDINALEEHAASMCLKMETDGFSETTVTIYQTTSQKIPIFNTVT
jgi:hypothetical protein